MKWYPTKLRVKSRPNVPTLDFLQRIYRSDDRFHYAEFGIYQADTALAVCEHFPNAVLSLFDFHATVASARRKLEGQGNEIRFYGNSQRFNDSYNWALIKMLQGDPMARVFDYCFLDGAHTVAIDALTFFLCDRMLRVGGHIDFDDYNWRLRNSSLDPSKVPVIARQYTAEQIDAFQVKMIVDVLVKPDARYEECVPDRVYRKIA